MLDTSEWKYVSLNDIFEIHYGVNLEYINCTPAEGADGVNFVSRSAENCGVTGRVQLIDGVHPEPAGAITIAGGGSVLSTFLQKEPFYSGRDLYVCITKKKLSDSQKLFLCTLICQEAYRYAYGRQANKTISKLKIKLPMDKYNNPDWEWIESYMASIRIEKYTTKNINIKKLNKNKWLSFKIKDLFKIETGKLKKLEDIKDGNDIYCIGAKKKNNSIVKKCEYRSDLVSKGNCIVFICTGQGSVGYSNYIDREFIGTSNIKIGYSRYLNKYIGMFIVTVFDLERIKYSYGRILTSRLADTIIKLPATEDGKPDWEYMENYIKSLPYGDCI